MEPPYTSITAGKNPALSQDSSLNITDNHAVSWGITSGVDSTEVQIGHRSMGQSENGSFSETSAISGIDNVSHTVFTGHRTSCTVPASVVDTKLFAAANVDGTIIDEKVSTFYGEFRNKAYMSVDSNGWVTLTQDVTRHVDQVDAAAGSVAIVVTVVVAAPVAGAVGEAVAVGRTAMQAAATGAALLFPGMAAADDEPADIGALCDDYTARPSNDQPRQSESSSSSSSSSSSQSGSAKSIPESLGSLGGDTGNGDKPAKSGAAARGNPKNTKKSGANDSSKKSSKKGKGRSDTSKPAQNSSDVAVRLILLQHNEVVNRNIFFQNEIQYTRLYDPATGKIDTVRMVPILTLSSHSIAGFSAARDSALGSGAYILMHGIDERALKNLVKGAAIAGGLAFGSSLAAENIKPLFPHLGDNFSNALGAAAVHAAYHALQGDIHAAKQAALQRGISYSLQELTDLRLSFSSSKFATSGPRGYHGLTDRQQVNAPIMPGVTGGLHYDKVTYQHWKRGELIHGEARGTGGQISIAKVVNVSSGMMSGFESSQPRTSLSPDGVETTSSYWRKYSGEFNMNASFGGKSFGFKLPAWKQLKCWATVQRRADGMPLFSTEQARAQSAVVRLTSQALQQAGASEATYERHGNNADAVLQRPQDGQSEHVMQRTVQKFKKRKGLRKKRWEEVREEGVRKDTMTAKWESATEHELSTTVQSSVKYNNFIKVNGNIQSDVAVKQDDVTQTLSSRADGKAYFENASESQTDGARIIRTEQDWNKLEISKTTTNLQTGQKEEQTEPVRMVGSTVEEKIYNDRHEVAEDGSKLLISQKNTKQSSHIYDLEADTVVPVTGDSTGGTHDRSLNRKEVLKFENDRLVTVKELKELPEAVEMEIQVGDEKGKATLQQTHTVTTDMVAIDHRNQQAERRVTEEAAGTFCKADQIQAPIMVHPRGLDRIRAAFPGLFPSYTATTHSHEQNRHLIGEFSTTTSEGSSSSNYMDPTQVRSEAAPVMQEHSFGSTDLVLTVEKERIENKYTAMPGETFSSHTLESSKNRQVQEHIVEIVDTADRPAVKEQPSNKTPTDKEAKQVSSSSSSFKLADEPEKRQRMLHGIHEVTTSKSTYQHESSLPLVKTTKVDTIERKAVTTTTALRNDQDYQGLATKTTGESKTNMGEVYEIERVETVNEGGIFTDSCTRSRQVVKPDGSTVVSETRDEVLPDKWSTGMERGIATAAGSLTGVLLKAIAEKKVPSLKQFAGVGVSAVESFFLAHAFTYFNSLQEKVSVAGAVNVSCVASIILLAKSTRQLLMTEENNKDGKVARALELIMAGWPLVSALDLVGTATGGIISTCLQAAYLFARDDPNQRGWFEKSKEVVASVSGQLVSSAVLGSIANGIASAIVAYAASAGWIAQAGLAAGAISAAVPAAIFVAGATAFTVLFKWGIDWFFKTVSNSKHVQTILHEREFHRLGKQLVLTGKTDAEVKQLYATTVRKLHPDRGGSKEKFDEFHNRFKRYSELRMICRVETNADRLLCSFFRYFVEISEFFGASDTEHTSEVLAMLADAPSSA